MRKSLSETSCRPRQRDGPSVCAPGRTAIALARETGVMGGVGDPISGTQVSCRHAGGGHVGCKAAVANATTWRCGARRSASGTNPLAIGGLRRRAMVLDMATTSRLTHGENSRCRQTEHPGGMVNTRRRGLIAGSAPPRVALPSGGDRDQACVMLDFSLGRAPSVFGETEDFNADDCARQHGTFHPRSMSRSPALEDTTPGRRQCATEESKRCRSRRNTHAGRAAEPGPL